MTPKTARSKVIMLIDNDSDDRFFFENALKEMDSYVCVVTSCGKDALEHLHAAAPLPDYIFMDLNMPEMNGMECLEELKKDKTLSGIPVIIYSTSNTKAEKEIMSKLGAAQFLVKPMDVSTLKGKILDTIASVNLQSGVKNTVK